MKKFARFMLSFFFGALYVCLYYPGVYLLSRRLAQKGAGDMKLFVLEAGACLLGLMLFFLLGHAVTVWLGCRKIAFPFGSFLAADTLMVLSFTVWKLHDPATLMAQTDSKELSIAAVKIWFVLIAGLVVLIISWLVSLLWGQVQKFSVMSTKMSMIEEEAALSARIEELKKQQAELEGAVPSPAENTSDSSEPHVSSDNPETPASDIQETDPADPPADTPVESDKSEHPGTESDGEGSGS